MKKIVFLVLLVTVTLISCKKEPQTEFNGRIIREDPTMCPCCGGYYIEIENASYRFYSLPLNSGIDLNDLSDSTGRIYPINVVVSFHKDDPQCMGDEIIIDKIRKR
jgi:hypothetical protein